METNGWLLEDLHELPRIVIISNMIVCPGRRQTVLGVVVRYMFRCFSVRSPRSSNLLCEIVLFGDVCCCFGVVAFLGEDLMGSSSILSAVIFVVEFCAYPYSCGCISIEDIGA